MDLNRLQLSLGWETLCAFRVSNAALEKVGDNELRWRLQLDDCSATVIAFAQYDGALSSTPQDGAPYLGNLSPRLVDDRLYAAVSDMWPMSADIEYINALSLLPRVQCPEHVRPWLDRLVTLGHGLRSLAMRALLGRIMADNAIYPGFLTCRASANHHHSGRGGLLQHSVDVAYDCSDSAKRLGTNERDVTIVAGLLHDLGKLRTVGAGPSRPLLGNWVHHEAITLEVIAPHMAWLDEESPREAALLRHALTWYSVKGWGFARFVGADIVRSADQVDVAYSLGTTGGNYCEPKRAR